MQDIGGMIKKERAKQGLSSYQLADKAGCTARSITYYETKQRVPTLEQAHKVLKALGLSMTIGAEAEEG